MRNNGNVNMINDLERYWSECTPLGDWKNIQSDMPLMTSFVHKYYNSKVSSNSKLAFYSDILSSFGDNNRERQIASANFNGLGQFSKDTVRDLVNNTINLRSDNGDVFRNEEMRKEFVSAIINVSGSQQNGTAYEKDISSCVSDPNALLQILSNTSVLNMLKNTNESLVNDSLPDILNIADTLRSKDFRLYGVFKKMLSALESYGCLLTLVNNIYKASVTIQPASTSTSSGLGVGIGIQRINVQTSNNNQNTIQNMMNDVNIIASKMQVFGNKVPDRVKAVLSKANPDDISDIKNIIMNTQIPIKNANKYALAISTAFATTQTDQVLAQVPRNIGIAMLYICKLRADEHYKTDSQTNHIAEAYFNIIERKITVTPGYRISMAQSIAYDMSIANYTATDALARLTNMPELSNFAKICLSKINSPEPRLTKYSIQDFMKTMGGIANQVISLNDVDSFLQKMLYTSNGNQEFRKQLIKSIASALQMI